MVHRRPGPANTSFTFRDRADCKGSATDRRSTTNARWLRRRELPRRDLSAKAGQLHARSARRRSVEVAVDRRDADCPGQLPAGLHLTRSAWDGTRWVHRPLLHRARAPKRLPPRAASGVAQNHFEPARPRPNAGWHCAARKRLALAALARVARSSVRTAFQRHNDWNAPPYTLQTGSNVTC